jgi:hypothetical protein
MGKCSEKIPISYPLKIANFSYPRVMGPGQRSKIFIMLKNSSFAALGGSSRLAEIRIVPSLAEFSSQELKIQLSDQPEK